MGIRRRYAGNLRVIQNEGVRRRRARRARENAVGVGMIAFVVVTGMGAAVTLGPKLAGKPSEQRSATKDEARLNTGTFRCTVSHVVDGDTLRCAESDARGRETRVRISGIDAREADGTCAPGHPCASASAEAATAELEQLASGQVLTCRTVGETYGRVAAFCQREDGTDLSCAMVDSGTVALWREHWGGHRC